MNIIYFRIKFQGSNIIQESTNPIQDGLFQGCSRMGGEGKKAPPP